MSEPHTPTEVQNVVVQWFQIARGVAQGQLTPEEGVAGLQALIELYPEDRDWLQEEVETIWRQFGLDVVDYIQTGQGTYWEKVRRIVTALIDERLEHSRALALLEQLDAQHPEFHDNTTRLIEGIGTSPLRRLLDMDV